MSEKSIVKALKIIAIIMLVLVCFFGVITLFGLSALNSSLAGVAFYIWAGAITVSLALCFALYGLGVLIGTQQDAQTVQYEILDVLDKINDKITLPNPEIKTAEKAGVGTVRCPTCDTINMTHYKECYKCGEKIMK